jgi:hypothetical protein
VHPAYFVVVEVSEQVEFWLEHDLASRTTVERASAYWTRIDPLLPDQVSIQVETERRLSADTLEEWRKELEKSLIDHGYELGGES